MDFSIGKTSVKRPAVRPISRFTESDSDEEVVESKTQCKEQQEVMVSVEDVQYCLDCHRAFADRSHLQRHNTACHRR